MQATVDALLTLPSANDPEGFLFSAVAALSFHSLRHTVTSWLKAAGVADGIVRAIVGHESVAMSQNYTHLDIAMMRVALEKLPV